MVFYMFRNYKLILLVILIVGVFVMPSNFFRNMTKNIVDHIKYRETYVTGEIIADNEDGTYDVKINNASSAYKNVETRNYGAIFSVGEIVDIGYEYGNKESPKILGSSKKIPQEPKQVEVDYSGGCAGVQTKTVTINCNYDGYIEKTDAVYANARDATSGDYVIEDNDGHSMGIANSKPAIGDYYIYRAFIYFDTSSIPTNANITIAKYSFKIEPETKSGTNNLVIQDGQPTYPHSTLILSDFNHNNYSNNGGQYTNISNLSDSEWNEITLNANGRAWINKGGTTKFCLRLSGDIAQVTPTGLNGVGIYMTEKGTGYISRLIITYEI